MPRNKYSKLFADAEKAFNGKYKDELNGLLGLSKKEIDAITPGASDLEEYSVLIKIVEKASQDNLSQAQLISDINALGEVARKIAGKIPRFADLLTDSRNTNPL
jgi:hypothetical protein